MDSIFRAEHVFHAWIRFVTPSHALSRITLFSRFGPVYRSMTLVDST